MNDFHFLYSVFLDILFFLFLFLVTAVFTSTFWPFMQYYAWTRALVFFEAALLDFTSCFQNYFLARSYPYLQTSSICTDSKIFTSNS